MLVNAMSNGIYAHSQPSKYKGYLILFDFDATLIFCYKCANL